MTGTHPGRTISEFRAIELEREAALQTDELVAAAANGPRSRKRLAVAEAALEGGVTRSQWQRKSFGS